MKVHELKSWPEFYSPIEKGEKNFDLRRNDRNFRSGDTIIIHEFDDRAGKYTGRDCRRRVTFVLEGAGSGSIPPLHGLARGFAILGLEVMP